MARPHKPIRWVNLLNGYKDMPIGHYKHRYYPARVETPIDSKGYVLVNVDGNQTYTHWLKWKNQYLSDDYPKDLVDKLESRLKQYGYIKTCGLLHNQLSDFKVFHLNQHDICGTCGVCDLRHRFIDYKYDPFNPLHKEILKMKKYMCMTDGEIKAYEEGQRNCYVLFM